MSFNEGVRLDTSKVQKRGPGGKAGAVGLGGLLTVLVLGFLSQYIGFDLTPLAGDIAQTTTTTSTAQLEDIDCATGADANASEECRMVGAADAIDTYWASVVRGYRPPGVVLFTSTTNTGCGLATAATGPFYCPVDQSIYLDTGFFETLRQDFGAETGSLAQMYILAHEWGHHISNLTGTLDQGNRGQGATGGSVRLELQADCYAGSWVGSASTVPEETTGIPFLKAVTQSEIDDALDAAAAVGDDHIMEISGRSVRPDRFTHGSSAQRQKWFMEGFRGGPAHCDTFSVAGADL